MGRRRKTAGRAVNHSAMLWLRQVAAAGLASLLWVGAAQAHKGSDAYLDVQETPAAAASAVAPGQTAQRSVRFTLSVAIKDLDQLLPLDANSDGRVTWGETRAVMPQVQQAVDAAAVLDSIAPTCALRWQFDNIEQRGDGAYVRLVAAAQCPTTERLALRYTLFREQDANHRLLVAGRLAGSDLLSTSSPLRADALPLLPATGADPAASARAGGAEALPVKVADSRWSALRDYFLLGMHHLLEGYDHMAFLLALVLPLRLVLSTGARRPSSIVQAQRDEPGSSAWWALLRTVTAFTVGHSVTLVLATLGWTEASPAWVEPVIALSIAVTALLNLRPVAWLRTDVLALLFGMVHGFGFAGLLQEAAAPSGLLPWALAGFNLGVEAGQLLAVGAWVLLSQAYANRPVIAHRVVRGGSALLIGLATFWFVQRVA